MMRIFFVSLYIKEYIKKNWFYDADNFAQYWDKNYEVVRNMTALHIPVKVLQYLRW